MSVAVGDRFQSKNYGWYEVIKKESFNKVLVRFDSGTEKYAASKEVQNGKIKDDFMPVVYGVGFIGSGKYTARFPKGGNTPCYDSWRGILRRAYCLKHQEDHPTYKGVVVDKEWYNFQNFADWYYNNLRFEGRVEVDKDLKIKGNKVYSSKTCELVPIQINALFTGAGRVHRGKYPLGVYFKKDVNKFRAQLHKGGSSQEFLGDFNTPEEAFFVYKNEKEKHVKQVIEKYKNHISEDLYNILINYKVEITD